MSGVGQAARGLVLSVQAGAVGYAASLADADSLGRAVLIVLACIVGLLAVAITASEPSPFTGGETVVRVKRDEPLPPPTDIPPVRGPWRKDEP